jgi:hypothetical protein
MSIITPLPPELPFFKRVILSIPVLGWMARDVLYGDRDNRIAFAVIVVFLWLLSVSHWGLAALAVPFVLAVPAAVWAWFAIAVARYEAKAEKARRG